MPDATLNQSTPIPIQVGNVGTGKVTGAIDAGGNSGTAPADVVFSSSNPAVLNVINNPDGTATAKPGTVGVAVLTARSASTGLESSQAFQVVAGPPVSLQVEWSWAPG